MKPGVPKSVEATPVAAQASFGEACAGAGRDMFHASTPSARAAALARHARLALDAPCLVRLPGGVEAADPEEVPEGPPTLLVPIPGGHGALHAWLPEAADAGALARAEALAGLAAAAFSAGASAQRGDRLLAVSSALSRAATPDEVVKVVVDMGVAALGAHAGAIARLQPDGKVHVLGSVGYPPELVEFFRAMPLDAVAPLTDAVRSGEGIFLQDHAERAARYPHLGRARRANGDGAMASVPFEHEGRVVGALGLNFREPRAFTPDERAFIHALARQCGHALERARLFDAERAARRDAEAATSRLSLLLEASTALAATSDHDATLATLADVLSRHLADVCAVYVRDGETLVPKVVRASDARLERRVRETGALPPHDVLGEGAVADVYRRPRVHSVPSFGEAEARRDARDEAHANALVALGLRAALLLPLRIAGEPHGVVLLGSLREGRAYGSDDATLAGDVVRRAASRLEKARLLQAAREVETRLQSIIRSVPGIVWEAWGDPQTGEHRVGFVSDHVEKTLGYTKEEWLAAPGFWLSIVHPEDRERAVRKAAEHFARGGEDVNEFRWIAKDGRVLHALTHAVVVKDERGRPIGLRGVTIDVTERKVAEEELRLYREIFAASNDAIATIGPDGTYVEQNAAHRELTGYSDEELRGRTPAVHLGEEVFREVAEELARAGRARREVVSTARDGRRLDVDLAAFTMRDAAGNVVRHVGMKRDITRRKRMEASLRDRIRELEAIYRLSEALGRAESVDQVYQAAMDCLAASLDAPRCSILLQDPEKVMRFVGWRNLSSHYREAVEGHSPWPADAVDPQPVAIPDAHADPSLAPLRPVLDAEGVRALLFVPLTHQGRLLGKFMVYHGEPHEFGPDELRLANTIASHLSFGLLRVRAEEERRASERRFRTLIQQSPLSTQVFTIEGDCILANEAWERLWETPVEALRGYNVLRDPQLAAKGVAEHVRRAFDGEIVDIPPVLYDPSESGKSGRPRWVRALLFPLRGSDGAPREVVLVLEDVTARKTAADALRENEQRLAGIFGSLAEGIALFDAEGRLTRLNPAGERILGATADEAAGRARDDALWAARDLEGRPLHGERHPVTRALRSGEACRDVEMRVHGPEGRDMVVSVNAVPLRALDGAVTGVAVSFSDVTERKAAEAALRRSELWLRSIFDSLDEAVLVVGWPERVITNANRALETIFGRSRDEVVGRSTRLLHVDDVHFEEYGRRVAEAFARGETARFEFTVARKDGTTFPSSQTVSLLKGPDGSILGALCVVRDLTEEKRARAELEAARRQVANTEKLSALGSLVSGVAHEIRTPLAYITNHLFLIQQRLDKASQGTLPLESLHSEVGRHSAAVMEGVDRINRIVGDLRRFTRLKAGERVEAPLDLVVLDAVDLFRATHRGRMSVETDLRPTPPLPLDHLQVQQVVLNLLDNAADAMGRAGAVRVSTRAVPGGAELHVADRGPGIPPDVQARMFDPLFTTKKEGTGLGLSIVRRIVEAHGGTLRFQTTSEGTVFTVFFPGGDGSSA